MLVTKNTMINNLLTQRFNFFEITLYRDYSVLSSKQVKTKSEDIRVETDGILDTYLFVDDNVNYKVISPPNTLLLQNRKASKKKNTKYFYCDDNVNEETIPIYPLGTFYTQREEKLKKYYGNPFASIKTTILERTINMSDDKISIRFSRFEKTRQVNSKYFKKYSYSMGVTMNLKTGNIIIYRGDKKLSKIRQNSFIYLKEVLRDFLRESKTCVNNLLAFSKSESTSTPISNINKYFLAEFKDTEYNNILFHALSSKFPPNNVTYFIDPSNISDFAYKGFLKLFIYINKIKAPNYYEDLMLMWYPTKPYLKKNENKLIVSILDRIGLKTKSIIKLVHKNTKLDISKLTLLGKYFGYSNVHKYIHNLTPNYFHDGWKLFDDQTNIESMFSILNDKFEYDIKDSERSILLKLINQFFDESNIDLLMDNTSVIKGQISQFNDHLDLITKIRTHIPDMEIKCTGLRDFHREHIELSKIESTIRKGYSIQYTFNEDLVKCIESVITQSVENTNESLKFYPVILKTDAQYTEEGVHMHHCVSTYADRENSIIISIRENSTEAHERVTCEYDLQKNLVQAKYFCNAVPPERFNNIIDKVNNRIKKYRGSIKSTGKEKIPLVINGNVIVVTERQEDSLYRLLFDRQADF